MPDHFLCCALTGRGQITHGQDQHRLKPGTCFVMAPGDIPIGRHDSDQPLTVFICNFAPTPEWPHASLVVETVRDLALLGHLSRAAVRWHARGDDLGRERAAGLVGQVLELMLAPQPPDREVPGDARVDAVAEMISENPAYPWSNAELGRRVSISPHYLARLFLQVRGQRLSEYIITQRVALAAQWLRETDATLSAIAKACGYDDTYYFNRQFRRLMGEPPGRWREQVRRAV